MSINDITQLWAFLTSFPFCTLLCPKPCVHVFPSMRDVIYECSLRRGLNLGGRWKILRIIFCFFGPKIFDSSTLKIIDFFSVANHEFGWVQLCQHWSEQLSKTWLEKQSGNRGVEGLILQTKNIISNFFQKSQKNWPPISVEKS